MRRRLGLLQQFVYEELLISEFEVYEYDPAYPDSPDHNTAFSNGVRSDTPTYFEKGWSNGVRSDTPTYFEKGWSNGVRSDTPTYSGTDIPLSDRIIEDLLVLDTFVPYIPSPNSDVKNMSFIVDVFTDYTDLSEQLKDIELTTDMVVGS